MTASADRSGIAKRILARIGAQLARPFCWWLRVTLGKEANIFLMPDSTSIVFVFWGVGFLTPWLIDLAFRSVILSLCAVFALPFVLLSALVINKRGIIYLKLIGPVPYWFSHIPKSTQFELYESWEDASPTGVAFQLSGDKYLHLGTSATAHALFTSIGANLERIGWRKDQFGDLASPVKGHDV
jgi:hypothetical protein